MLTNEPYCKVLPKWQYVLFATMRWFTFPKNAGLLKII